MEMNQGLTQLPASQPRLYSQEDLLFIAEAAAKKTVDAIEQMNRRNAKKNDPVQAAKRMLSSYRRLKIAQQEDVRFSEAEGLELRWHYLIDLMGAPDRQIITEDAAYAREKKLQYNQYKIQQIESAVAMYQKECENSGNEEALRRYRIVEKTYMTEQAFTAQEIADAENISVKTVYYDLGIAHKIIAVYLSAV